MGTFTNNSDNCVNANGVVRPPRRLLDQLSESIRLKHYSIRTEQAYRGWVRRFILFHGKRHPQEMGAREVEAFLTHLAVEGRVSASTQNQAKSALLFLYKEVLRTDLPWLDDVESAKSGKRLPVVLTPEEVQRLLGPIDGTTGLILRLLYGTGMRMMECLRLRVKDVDFARREILVREGKGFKDRVTMLPERLVAPLGEHLARVKALHAADLAAGFGDVYLPWALERKYPNTAREWAWQYVFVAARRSVDPRFRGGAATSRGGAEYPACDASGATAGGSQQSWLRRTLCAIRSPRPFWKPATTFAPYRNCWAMPM
jgi:integron integrase